MLLREFRPNRVAVEAISVNGSGHGRKCGNVASAGRATSETRSKRSTSVTIFFFIPPAIFVGFVCFFIIDILIFLTWNVDWKSSCGKSISTEFRLTHLGIDFHTRMSVLSFIIDCIRRCFRSVVCFAKKPVPKHEMRLIMVNILFINVKLSYKIIYSTKIK